MNALLEKYSLRTICNELLHPQELVFTASFEALRLMQDEFFVAPENQFILDIVEAALATINHLSQHDE